MKHVQGNIRICTYFTYDAHHHHYTQAAAGRSEKVREEEQSNGKETILKHNDKALPPVWFWGERDSLGGEKMMMEGSRSADGWSI